MHRIHAIGRVLSGLNVDAFVRVEEKNVVIEMTLSEFQRCQSMLDPWFEMVSSERGSVLLKEKVRGIAEV